MQRLRRKIDNFLIEWKTSDYKLPLIVKGARQIGKTNAIRYFGSNFYKSFIEINFALEPEFKSIFKKSFDIDVIIKEITMRKPDINLIPNNTLIFLMKCKNVRVLLLL